MCKYMRLFREPRGGGGEICPTNTTIKVHPSVLPPCCQADTDNLGSAQGPRNTHSNI
jgi:hypothetical protein